MAELILTRESIEADIEAYQARIQSARDSLEALPATVDHWKQRKKLKAQRHALAEEIAHVQRMLCYAREALEEGVTS